MKILHITDLHIGWKTDLKNEKADWERLYRETRAAAADGQKAHIIAVTGDLVMHGTEEEYRRVEEYLHGLRKVLGLGRDKVFFCCGNHDSDTPEAGSTFLEYEAFLKRFYDGETPSCKIPVFSINCCKKTSLAHFNDCWLDPEDVDQILKNYEKNPGQKGVLLLHHQPEIFDDQSQIIRLNQAVSLILGGHLHSGYTRQITWKGMTVVNGMAITPHLGFIARGFQMVELSEDGTVETVMYVYRDGEGVLTEKAF